MFVTIFRPSSTESIIGGEGEESKGGENDDQQAKETDVHYTPHARQD